MSENYVLSLEGQVERLKARVAATSEALEMVLLFHSGSHWDAEKAKRWERWTGGLDATTRVMCDQIRCVLEEKP